MDRTVVFLGPSLARASAEAILAADYQPPARRGDIYRAVRAGTRCIVLIDGEFHGSPSVWPREILDALDAGVPVYGASSMGALRAAELHPFGMLGVGRIFHWYREGIIEADDEVALIHGPAELGWPALSEPLVNVRATLEDAGPVFTPAETERVLATARGLYFPERTRAALLASLMATGADATLGARLNEHWVDQKRLDAEQALLTVAAGVADPPGLARKPHPDWARARLAFELGLDSSSALSAEQVARAHGLDPSRLPEFFRILSARFFEQRAAAEGDADLAAWIRRQGIRRAGLDERALRDWVIAAGPPHFGYASWHFETALDLHLRGISP
ncbi:hypothetical protein Thiowin_01460 [Thiorhodovibrio winogradskyi]|uniref:TfuA-like core domain-containing protein n=1 Tax=Thiorhodovibrio winogradskyi TaxID=77007 RepID=A0ABZ0S7N3_9GAMM|nr:TfuA-like protein [Thiorhodovibrio winogradskyi]